MDATPAELLWDRGSLEAECDRAKVVRDGVEAYLQRSVFVDSASNVVRVRLSRVSENGKRHVVAQVSQEDQSGRAWGARRVVGDEDCASLDEQLTLVVALMVDTPNAGEPAAPEPAASEPPEPAPPSPLPASEPPSEIITAPSLQRPAPSPGHFVMLGFGAASFGATPELGVGGGLALSLKPRGFWGIGLEGTLLKDSRQALDAGSLEISFAQAALSLCPLQAAETAVWWSACASLGGARLHARSRGLIEQRSDTQWLLMPGISVRGARIFWHRFLVGGGIVAAVPVSPDRYVYRDAEGGRQSAFQMSSLVLMAQVGMGIILN